jgi:hypothetical protein
MLAPVRTAALVVLAALVTTVLSGAQPGNGRPDAAGDAGRRDAHHGSAGGGRVPDSADVSHRCGAGCGCGFPRCT